MLRSGLLAITDYPPAAATSARFVSSPLSPSDNWRPKRSANIRKPSMRCVRGYLPALRMPASYLAAGSRSSFQGVACSGKRLRRTGGVVPLRGYVERFWARPWERVGVEVVRRIEAAIEQGYT